MYQDNYTHSYVANASIRSLFRREIAYETGEGHLLRASHMTRSKIFFDFGHPHRITSFAMNTSDVSRISVCGRWVTKSSHHYLYQYYRGVISQSDMCAKLTTWPCGESSPRSSPGIVPPPSPSTVPPTVNLDTLMTKLEAIENVLHKRRSDGQPPRRKKKSNRKAFKPVVFVSSSESNTESVSEKTPEVSDSEKDTPAGSTSTTPEPGPAFPPIQFIPYDDTYDRMSAAYRHRGLRFLQALDLILLCTGEGDYAMRMYLQMHNAHDIILNSGYRLTRSREPQLEAMQRIASENGIVPDLIRLWNLVPSAMEGSYIAATLTYEQLHFCCVHPPLTEDQ